MKNLKNENQNLSSKKKTRVLKTKGMTISKKIILSIIITNVVIVAIIAGMMGFTLDRNIRETSRTTASNLVQSNVNRFEQDFFKVESAVSVLTSSIGQRVDVDRVLQNDEAYIAEIKSDIVSELQAIGADTGISRSIYSYLNVDMFGQEIDMWVLNEGGSYTLQDSFGLEYYSAEYYEWYNKPLDTKEALWTFPYISEDGNLISSYVHPIIKDGQAIGIVGMDFYMDDIEKVLSEITLFDTGYLFLMHPDGRVIYHPELEIETNITTIGDYSSILEEMNEKKSGVVTYDDVRGVRTISAYSHLENGWIIASNIPENEVFKLLRTILITMLIIAVLAIAVSIIVASIIGRSISKPIIHVVGAVDKIKDGDFTVTVNTKSNDETKILSDSINEMISNVKNLIKSTKDVSLTMVEEASSLAAMSEEASATANQVENTVNEISKGTNDAAMDSESSANLASSMDEKFKSLTKSSAAMRENAEQAMEINKEGASVLNLLKEKSEISITSNKKVSDAVNNLDSKTKQISEIISTITSITEQTNLLALNASIEAARAGNAGKGFAVVADEIRKLADSSAMAAKEIAQIVTNIQNESKETVSVIGEVAKITEEQGEAVVNVDEALSKIFKSVESIVNQIENVSNQLMEVDEDKNNIVLAIDNISAVTEEIAASSQEVSASMSQQTIAVEEVAVSAEKLNELSSRLNENISIFKV